MDARAIALAIPFFLLCIGLELFLNQRRGDTKYRLHDSVTGLGCGVGQQVLAIVFVEAVKVGAYTFAYERFRLTTVSPRSPFAWVVLLFAVDLAYYAYHWASHRVNFFWASHAVHHQSEEYNLSTALRQSWFTGLTSWIFYIPIALGGFSPLMFVLMHTVNTLYQFWIHTQAIDRIGPLEAIFNTPSHHRVHHGINPEYIDKNYGGIFIFWDRLFGTFQREEQAPVYGTVKPLSSFDALWANLDPVAELFSMARQTRRLRDKFLVFLKPPEWRPLDLGGPVNIPEVTRATRSKYETVVPRGLDGYVLTNVALSVLATAAFLWFSADLSTSESILVTFVILLSLSTWGPLFETKPWAIPFEWGRLAFTTAIVVYFSTKTAAMVPLSAGAFVVSLGFAVWVGQYRRAPALPTESAIQA